MLSIRRVGTVWLFFAFEISNLVFKLDNGILCGERD